MSIVENNSFRIFGMPLGAVSCASIIMGENEGDEMYQYSLTQWLFFFYFFRLFFFFIIF